MSGKMLELNNISFQYYTGSFSVEAELVARKSELTVIVGPNGAGKSTILKLAAGLLRPSAGKIFLEAKKLSVMSRKEIASKLAYIPSETNSVFEFTGREIVEMGRYARKAPFEPMNESDQRAIENALAMVDASELENRDFRNLSSGERQRIMLARAIAQEANWLLFDEPTVHLDIKHQIEFFKLLKKFAASENKGLIVVTHEISIASIFADSVAVVSNGRVIRSGSREILFDKKLLFEIFGVNFEFINIHGNKVLFPQAGI